VVRLNLEIFLAPKENTANRLADGTRTAYFRGRKLQGTAVKLPEGYRGVFAAVSAPEESSRRPEEAEVSDLEAGMPQGSLQVQAEFDEMVIWGHETAVDAAADPHLRAADEWLGLAEKVGPGRFGLLVSPMRLTLTYQINAYPIPTANNK
jgi:hypothetical protein